jgi:ABC-type dipeptide/oligopeptide/nickel transport system permease subunit
VNMRENEADAPSITRGLRTAALGDSWVVESPEQGNSSAQKAKKSLSPFQESLLALRRDIRAMISLGILLLFVLLALIGPPIYQHIGGTYPADLGGNIGPTVYHAYDHEELSQQNQGPSARYWLGTDPLGRDMLARLMQGILVSLIVALLVEVVDIGVGMSVGILAGYYGGWIDTLLARLTDLIFAFPGLLFAILLTSIFNDGVTTAFGNWPLVGPFLANGNATLVIVSLALALVSWPLMARYVRGQTLQIKQQQFIEAARSSGTSDLRIMWRHIIPNLLSFVIIASSLNIANTIVGESGLSLLGLGVREPGSSLGLMIFDGLDTLETIPWNALLPTIVLTIVVLAISFVSDGLRDALDPHTQH